jgi:hypothetical protein
VAQVSALLDKAQNSVAERRAAPRVAHDELQLKTS